MTGERPRVGAGVIDESQRIAARIVGLAYLIALPMAVFAEYATGSVLDLHSAAATARNLTANEGLFRVGVATNLAVFGLDVILIAALYRVLAPIGKGVALAAAFWRLIETSILVSITLDDLSALRFVSQSDYLAALAASDLNVAARLALAAHSASYNVGLIFAGLGSAAFGLLWLRSRYVPRWLAVLGIVASMILAVLNFSFLILPAFRAAAPVLVYGGPIFVFELTIGVWLLWKGLPSAPRL